MLLVLHVRRDKTSSLINGAVQQERRHVGIAMDCGPGSGRMRRVLPLRGHKMNL